MPPSPKALSWFCCQPESSAVFPLIFVSKNVDNPTCKSLFVNGSRGVFGVGAAVSFVHSSAGNNKSLIKRSVTSTKILFLLVPSFLPGHDGWRFKLLIFIDSLWK